MKTIVRKTPVRLNNLPSIFDELFFNDETKNSLVKKNNPLVNIKETEVAFEIAMQIPGYKKEDILIKIDNELLTISSERTNGEVKKNEKFTKKEFGFTQFSRSFTLPEIVDIDKIEANNENGILFLNLPKNKVLIENKVKTISIS